MMSSSAKKVIIIGASSGIGRALALLYIQAGCQVGITGRRCDALQEIKNQYPGQVYTACFDVMGAENVPQLESLIGRLGGMDLLIYNAGYGEISKTLDWNIEKTTTLTNVNGFIEIAVYAFNYFVRQGHGQLAGTSSIAAMAGNGVAPAYSAGKAFMSNYLEGLYIRARKLKIPLTIIDIQPGFVDTKMSKGEKRFWVAPVEKAALQVFHAIGHRRFRVYITRRWWLVAQLVKLIPGALYRRLG
jgi:short-subunit dehydrogenase